MGLGTWGGVQHRVLASMVWQLCASPDPHHPPLHTPGDIHRYDALCAQHAALLNAQPALVAHERRLREKITILCLMELISGLPPDARSLPLQAIADATKLPLDGVEFLLMKVGAVWVGGWGAGVAL